MSDKNFQKFVNEVVTNTGAVVSSPVTVSQGGTGSTTGAIAVTGTISKGLDFAAVTPAFSDDDDAFVSVGTWNDAKVITGQTTHFVPIQVHIHSGTSVAKDIAASRLRVDTSAANTLTAVQVQQIRSSIGHDVASAAAFGAGMSIDANMAVQTGELVCGGFSIAGTGKVTPAGTNPVTVLQACNWNTAATESVWYVFDAYQNAAGNTVRSLLRGNVIAGTATNGLEIANTSGTLTRGIKFTGTIGIDIVLQNGQTITNANAGVVQISDITRVQAIEVVGSSGGLRTTFWEASASSLSGSTAEITVNIPASVIIRGVQLRVDTAITTATAWTAAFSGGNTTTICTGQSVDKNTKVNSFSGGLTTATTQITLTPEGGNFGGGAITAIVYYDTLTSMASV